MTEQTKPEKYRLKSEGGRPANLQDGQETRLYNVMEELMKALKGPATMDQIVKQAEYRKYQHFSKRKLRWNDPSGTTLESGSWKSGSSSLEPWAINSRNSLDSKATVTG